MTAYKSGAGGSGTPGKGEKPREVCSVCGQPSDEDICATCADKIRAEALADTAGDAPAARHKPGQKKP
jgi:hypothetical protein